MIVERIHYTDSNDGYKYIVIDILANERGA